MLCHIDKTFSAPLPGNPVFYAGEILDVPDSNVAGWQRAGLLHPIDAMAPGDVAAPRPAMREKAARLRAPNTRRR